MKMIKALLVGSAASLVGFAAQAADLPKKAAPAEYVRVCNGYGAGFYMIPGSQTCIQIGGFIRSEIFAGTQGGDWRYTSGAVGTEQGRYGSNSYTMGARFFLHADVRTQTSMGTVRSYGRFFGSVGSPGYGNSSAPQLFPSGGSPVNAATSIGQYQSTPVGVLEAFVQFAGVTTGFAMSNFGFYNGAWNFQDLMAEHDYRAVQLAYTASLGNGINATIALEDRSQRVQAATGVSGQPIVGNLGTTAAAIALATGAGAPIGWGANRRPDIVANLNVTQAWGKAQLMGAVTEVIAATGASKTGYAVGAGAEINAGPNGSAFLVQLGYANGAVQYVSRNTTTALLGNGAAAFTAAGARIDNGIFTSGLNSAFYNGAGGIDTSTALSLLGGYNAVWSPSFRTSLLLGYVDYKTPAVTTQPSLKSINAALTANYTVAPGFTLGAELFYEKATYSYNAPVFIQAHTGSNTAVFAPNSTNALGLNLRVQRAF